MAESIALSEEDIKPNEVDNLNSFHIRIFNISTRSVLSTLLNVRKELPEISEEIHISRDWRGLAQLIDVAYHDIRQLERKRDPTSAVLDLWERKNDATIGTLLKHLEKMDRFDIIADLKYPMIRNAKEYERKLQNSANGTIQGTTVGYENEKGACQAIPFSAPCASVSEVPSIYDVQALAESYDAFICYYDTDSVFVKELTQKMEQQYHLRLFVKDRDMLLGVPEFTAQLRVLQKKCRKFVIVCTPEFVASPLCKAILAYAQHIAMTVDQFFIIPVIYKKCILPEQLRHIFNLDFNSLPIFQNFWEKLAESIKPELASYRLGSRVLTQSNKVLSKVHQKHHTSIKNGTIPESMFGYEKKHVEASYEQEVNEEIRLQRKREQKEFEMSDSGSAESSSSKTNEGSCSSISLNSRNDKLTTNEINEEKEKTKDQRNFVSKVKGFLKKPKNESRKKEPTQNKIKQNYFGALDSGIAEPGNYTIDEASCSSISLNLKNEENSKGQKNVISKVKELLKKPQHKNQKDEYTSIC